LVKQVGRGETRLDPLLAGLAASVDDCFGAEEAQMLDRGYPFVKEHKAQHDTFRRFVAEMRQEITSAQQDRLYLVFRIQLLLVDSLITHIIKSDIHLGNFLRRAGAA
jgi:hemerythrin